MDINYLKLGLTLFISLTLAGLTIDGVELLFASMSANAAIKQANVELTKFQEQQKSQQIQSYIKSQQAIEQSRIQNKEAIRKQNIEIQRLQSRRKTNDETCRYWTLEVQKLNSDYNKYNQKAACTRAAND